MEKSIQLKKEVRMKSTGIVVAACVLCLALAAAAEQKTRQWHTASSVGEDWKKESSLRIFDERTVAQLQAALKESRAVWEREKTARQDSYTLTRGFSSWTGFGHHTEVKVEKGVVVQKRFEAFDRDGQTTSAFAEGPDEIGSHSRGESAKTMDALYEDCAVSYLAQNPETHTLSLEFSEEGVLTSCTYRPLNCADDCSKGLNSVTLIWGVQ
jgi:hypothetical protein